jgi:hypothetical protein
VYNFHVEELHCYAVGGEGVVVHNASGIYEFPDQTASGINYVGQAVDLAQRLATHKRNGRLKPGTETTTLVPGTKTDREIAEHKRIQQLTGGQKASKSPLVANKVDPIGAKRRPNCGLPEPTD